MREKKELKAVHEDDLDSFLESLGLKQALESGALSCALCGSPISDKNLGMIFTHEGEIKLCCNKPDCYLKANELRRGGK